MRYLTVVALLIACVPALAQHHYVFFNRDREKIADQAFLQAKKVEGAQLKYVWRELEPEKNAYKFDSVRADLAFLTSKGKRLFIQLQDVSFDGAIVNVPRYLKTEPEFNGGVARQYDGDTPAGWVARRWDPAVQERLRRLFEALGREFDGRIEGINLPETAIDFSDGKRLPAGFTYEGYRDATIANMRALKRAFPKSVTMQYANFMPGEWLPENDRSYLRSVYRAAREIGVGVGGPDLLPYRPGQLNHAYPLIRESSGIVRTGIAVQTGNYRHTNPKTGKRVSIKELMDFAREVLRVDYLFWSTEEPFYKRDVLPVLN